MALNDVVNDLVEQTFNNQLIPGATIAVDVTVQAPAGGYEPGSGFDPAPAPVAAKAIRRDYSEMERSIAGGRIEQGDQEFRVRPNSSFTNIDESFKINDTTTGKTFSVQNVKTKKMGNTTLLFICQCRED